MKNPRNFQKKNAVRKRNKLQKKKKEKSKDEKKQAEKLHNEDEITVKETGEILTVLSVEVYSKKFLVCCNDGNTHHHRDIR